MLQIVTNTNIFKNNDEHIKGYGKIMAIMTRRF